MGVAAHMSRTLIVIPTYNEAANLEPLVTSLRAHAADADILVVDDASPDGTGAIADQLARDPACTCCTGPARKDWVSRTALGSRGDCSSRSTTGSSRWTPTGRTSGRAQSAA